MKKSYKSGATSESLNKLAQQAVGALATARKNAYNALTDIVKLAGGFIPTIPSEENPTLTILVDYDESGCLDRGTVESEVVYGLRYVEGEGLMVLTEACLKNYEYDNDYVFFEESSVDDVQGEDLKHLNKALADETYFESFHETYIIGNISVDMLLNGIGYYV